jgi:signal peptidase I
MPLKHLSPSPEYPPHLDAATGLFEDLLNGGSRLRVRVTGQSMWPLVRDGDVVTIKKALPSSLRVGNLIFFVNAEGSPVLHRLIRKRCRVDGRMMFQTKGDALLSKDEPVLENRVLGKVCRIEQKNALGHVKSVDLESGFWSAANEVIARISLVVSAIRCLMPSLNRKFLEKRD